MNGGEVRYADPDDIGYVMSLQRANRESVGGLPQPALLERIARGTMLVALVNDDPIGYLMWDTRGGVTRVPQACIQYDARRRRYGEVLVFEMVRANADSDEIRVRCAADLEANLFWRDMGFTCTNVVIGGARRGRKLNIWSLWLTPRLITVSSIGVTPSAQIRVDAMYDDTDYLSSAPTGFSDAELLPKMAWADYRGGT
jgi:hypothetical protein